MYKTWVIVKLSGSPSQTAPVASCGTVIAGIVAVPCIVHGGSAVSETDARENASAVGSSSVVRPAVVTDSAASAAVPSASVAPSNSATDCRSRSLDVHRTVSSRAANTSPGAAVSG
ncbi:hypothetical protein H9L21_14345 [Aeromicrobium senzhongii]|uniref:Secreted protein n=1 Tax=Aeromicrobium senzhongii TaxID=2663859 RepID=A0ABX6SS68_9ACTN|nr:hypothetical protein [Aeromicrobium senzhongii]QNL94238.1 hypothetical protein H9L21_14345 [Aeromicrobium senzhongii]